MSCSLQEHKRVAGNEISAILTDTKTLSFNDGVATITPSPTSTKVKTIEQAHKYAENKMKEVQDWAEKKYGKAFSKGWIGLNKVQTTDKKVVMTVGMPLNLQDAINIKLNQEKALQEFKSKEIAETPNEGVASAPATVPDTKLREKYFSAGQVSTTLSILDKIAKSNHPLNKLAEKLKTHAKHNNISIVLKPVSSFEMEKGNAASLANGFYNPNTNTIQIAENGNFPADGSESVILHEILHSITYKKLRDSSTVSKDFQALYEYTKTQVGKQYAISNVDEFIVALFTNPGFINELKDIPASKNHKKYDNLFQEIFDYILSLVNIGRSNSLYEQAFSNATHILEEFKDASQAMEDSMQHDLLFSAQEGTYGAFENIGGMPFQHSTIAKMSTGDQSITIRTANHPTGNYTINGEQYNVVNIGKRNIAEFKDAKALKKKFKGDDYEEGRFEHIDRFFAGKRDLYVYQITKIDPSNLNENITYSSALSGNPKYKKSKQPVNIPFEEQYTFFKRRINTLQKQLDKVDPSTDEYEYLKNELDTMKERLVKATEDQDRDEYVAMAKEYLEEVERLAERLPSNPTAYDIQELTNAFETLKTFDDFKGVRDMVDGLREKLFPYIAKHNLSTIQKFDTSGKTITQDEVDSQDTDIRWSSKVFGSLLDSVNLIGRTIGSLIKSAQNRSSLLNKQLETVVQAEVDKLSVYAKENNMTLQQVYDMFIQDTKSGTTQLANKYLSTGDINPNYEKIQNTPELKAFYDYYQATLKLAEMNLPYKVGKFYILNKAETTVKGDIRNVVLGESIMLDSFVSNEELVADMVPEIYRKAIPKDKKSRDLGAGLLEFAAYTNNHNELSKVLPETRLLQEQLKYKQNPDGSVEERKFVKSSDPTKKVNAEDSNVYQMVKMVIDMQLKGKMTTDTLKPIKTVKIKDKQGNVIGYKQVHIEDIIDKTLKLNSLLRIGLSPITALSNVLFGGAANYIEAIGGMHFNVTDLAKANGIFFNQIDYVSSKKDSNLHQWLMKLNPLQELADYELGSGLKAQPKKLTGEKAYEMMYTLQKKGELKLQATTMLAMLIHDGYMNPDGTNTDKGNNITEEQASQLSDKIQRLNQQIHGRYTQREAAAYQQFVWFRMAMQFRKWIPAAIESRFGDPRYDNRLQTDIEGRYRTMKNKVFKADNIQDGFMNLFLPILNSKAALERGNMTATEVYNMRKNMVELILLLSTVLLAAWVKSGDDDEERKKKLKNPMVKTLLTVLNRVSGDLMFFYNPSNVGNMASNAAPVAKLIKDVIRVGMHLPHAMYLGEYETKRGSLKGTNSFYTKDLPAIIPGIAPWMQVQKILNDKDIIQEL